MPILAPHLPTLAERFLSPRRFFAPCVTLTLRHDTAACLAWEVFQGRLLDPAHTRQTRTFATWGLYADPGSAEEPILSLRFDAELQQLHVVRAVEGYVWEGFDAGGGVFESRERRKWLRELIATFDLTAFDEIDALGRELQSALGRAVVGTRLPLTPVETPLPAFSIGQIAYGPDDSAPASPDAMLTNWLDPAITRGEGHRILEAWLRACSGRSAVDAADRLSAVWDGLSLTSHDFLRLARRIFDDISLSPWTQCVPYLLDLLDLLADRAWLPLTSLIDFQSSLLRLVGRHLTAYDLVTFHHRGANYPDALLLDELLRRYLLRIEQMPEQFEGPAQRLRRRALRQGYIIRRRYEGHPVPETPTSPGERMRVYPDSQPRISEEQIFQPGRRRTWLFAGDRLAERLGPATRRILQESFDDLENADEWQELGTAVYLDRPLGGAKQAVEPDGTPLLASLAFSRAVAEQRLRLLGHDLGSHDSDLARLAEQLAFLGVGLEAIGPAVRQGTVTLVDAGRVSADFVFRHTLPGSRRAFLELFDWSALQGHLDLGRLAHEPWLLARSPTGPGLTLHDESQSVWLQIEPALEQGYSSRDGLELPAAGLRVTHIAGERLSIAISVGVKWTRRTL